MTDIFTLLDAAIERVAIAPSGSRSSRLPRDDADGAGTAISLQRKDAPVVPVVPVAKQGFHAGTAGSEIEALAAEFGPSSSVSSSFTGFTGTTGNPEGPCGLQRSRNSVEHGTYGNPEPAALCDELVQDGLPRWLDGFECLRTMGCPSGVQPWRWRQAIIDAGAYLARWGAQASELGWTTLDIFGAHPTRPIQRLDCAGLILLLHGDELIAITATTARIRTRTGATMTFYRRPQPSAVPLWELT